MLQSLAGSTFDSSQLVLTACMGYQAVSEMKLEDLRKKHRPEVLAVMEERSRGLRVWKDSQGLASKLYSFKRGPESLHAETDSKVGSGDFQINGLSEGYVSSLAVDGKSDSVPDLKEQVIFLPNQPMFNLLLSVQVLTLFYQPVLAPQNFQMLP